MPLRQRAARMGIMALLPLVLAGCGTGGYPIYDTDPLAGDFVNMRIAVSAQRRGDEAATARAYARVLRNTGHPLADLQLGRFYADGRGVPQDPVKAAEHFQAAYTKDWPGRGDAAFYLGRMYENGLGVPEDKEKAFELYSFASSRGVKAASYPLARFYDEGTLVQPNHAKAIDLYAVAAEMGDQRASLRLAELAHEAGAAPERVHALARPGIAWLRELAKEDNEWAEMRLANIYQEGTLAPPSTELAERYLRDAAKHGNATANARLAERLEAAGDPKRALGHWRRAAEGGHPSGMVRVGMAELEAGRISEGLAWLERAAELGHPSAMVEIGRRELAGDGVPANPEAALAMLTKAAELGHPSAMYTLGQTYADGKLVPLDKDQARQWFEKAQGAGHPSAEQALTRL